MAARDRVSVLRLIERLRRHEVEVTGAQLASLRSEQAALEDQSAALTATANWEAANSTVDTRPFLPGFISSVDSKQKIWAEQKDQLEQHAARKEADLLQSFQASKTIEIVLDRAVQAIKQDEDKAEIAALDEVSRSMAHATRAASKTTK